MYKHLVTAIAFLGLCSLGTAVRADLREQQRAQQHLIAYLGVRVDTVARGPESREGVIIREVQRDGPAARVGLRSGDVITQVGRRIIEDFDDLKNAIIRHQPGDRVLLHVLHDGKEQNVEVNLSLRPARWVPQADEESDAQKSRERREEQERFNRGEGGHVQPDGDVKWLEHWLAQLEKQLQEQTAARRGRPGSDRAERNTAYLGVETRQWVPTVRQLRDGTAQGGVEVMEVAPGSPASEGGLRSGDVILAVNSQLIESPDHLYQVVQRIGSNREIALEVLRGERKRKLRALLSASGVDVQALRRLERQVELMEKRLARQDRYGLKPSLEDEESRDLDELQREIRQMNEHLREIEQNRKKNRTQDK